MGFNSGFKGLIYLPSTIDEGNANIKQWQANSGKVQPRYSQGTRTETGPVAHYASETTQ